MRVRKGPVLLIIFLVSATVAVAAATALDGAALLTVVIVLMAAAAAGASGALIATALRRELQREVPTPVARTRSMPAARRSERPRPGNRRAAGGGGNRSRKTSGGRNAGSAAKVARVNGKVKWFDPSKGFGFITPDDGSKDFFVHRSSIEGGSALREGNRVDFEPTTDERGRRAAGRVRDLGA